MSNSKLGRVIAIATAVCVILLGIAYVLCTAHLYYTGGEKPYSSDSVGSYLKWLAIPSVITLLLAVFGVVYNAASGEKVEKNTERTETELLESFGTRCDFSTIEGETANTVNAERKNRDTFRYIAFTFSALIFVLILVYMLLVAEFTVENLNADVMAAFTVVIPLSAIAVGIHVPRLYFAESSAKRELDAIKEYIKKKGALNKPEAKKADERTLLIARYVILGVSVVLIVLGLINGGAVDVLQKAVKICTECIGLG